MANPFRTLVLNNLGSRNVGPQGARGIGQNGVQGVRGEKGAQGDSGSGTGNLPVNDTVFVDVQFGDNATGQRENAARPFRTINAALTAALVGDVVYVHPGTYAESMVLRDGIDFYFELGAVINPPAGGVTGGYAFADTTAPVSARIKGYVVIDISHGGASGGAVNMTRPTSFLDFQGIRATISATGNTVGHTIYHQAGRMKVNLVGLHNLSTAAGGTALTFNSGESIVTTQGITTDTIALAAIHVDATTTDPLELTFIAQEFQANVGTALLVETLTSAVESHIDIRSQSMMGGQETIHVTDAATNGEINVSVESFLGGVLNNAQVPAGNATLELNIVATHFTGSNIGGLPAIRAIGGSTNFTFQQANTVNGPFLSTDSILAPFGIGLNGVIVTGTVGHLAPQGTGNVIDVAGNASYPVNVALRFNVFDFDVEPPQYAVTVRDGGNLSLDAEIMACRDPTLTLTNALSVDTASLLECRIAQLSVPGQALYVANGSRATCIFQVLRRESSGAAVGPALPIAEASMAGFMVFDAQEVVTVPQIAANTALLRATGSITLPRIGYFHGVASDPTSKFVQLTTQAQMVGTFQVIVAEGGAAEPTLIDVGDGCFISGQCNLLVGGRAFDLHGNSGGTLYVARITNGSGSGPSISLTDGGTADMQVGALDCAGQAILVENSSKPGQNSQLNLLFDTINAGNDGGLALIPAISVRGITGGRAVLQLVGSEINGNNANDVVIFLEGDADVRANVNVVNGQNTGIDVLDAGGLHGRFGQITTQRSPAILLETVNQCNIQCEQISANGPSIIGVTPQAAILIRNSRLGNGAFHNLNAQSATANNFGMEYVFRLEGNTGCRSNLDNLNAFTGGVKGISLADTSNIQMRLGQGSTNDEPLLECFSTNGASLQFQSIFTQDKIACIYANAGQIYLDGTTLNAGTCNSALVFEDQAPGSIFPNCIFRIEELRGNGDPGAPAPYIWWQSSGQLNGRFDTLLSNDSGNGGTTIGVAVTAGNVSLEGVQMDVRNNLSTARAFVVSNNAAASFYVKRVFSDLTVVDLSTSNNVWSQLEEAQVLNGTDPVVRLTAPGPGQGSYTVGGYMRTPGPVDIDIAGADVPSVVRVLSSVLVNNGAGFSIDSANPVMVIMQQSIATTIVNGGTVTLAPAAALLVDGAVQ